MMANRPKSNRPQRNRNGRWRCFVASLALLPALASANPHAVQALAQGEVRSEQRYADCIRLAERAPDKGINAALEWQLEAGGVPARHCEAVGLYYGGEYAEAAIRLERIAEDMRIGRGMPVRGDKRSTASPSMLADTYGQAAEAWLLAGELVRAEAAIGEALALVPGGSALEASLREDRAHIAAADEDFVLALSELEAVLARDPGRVDILLFIASAARGTGNFIRANQALDAYRAVYPDDPSALLELGNLRDAEGDAPAARQAWLKLLQLSPEGPDADAARANLERLDVNKSDRAVDGR